MWLFHFSGSKNKPFANIQTFLIQGILKLKIYVRQKVNKFLTRAATRKLTSSSET